MEWNVTTSGELLNSGQGNVFLFFLYFFLNLLWATTCRRRTFSKSRSKQVANKNTWDGCTCFVSSSSSSSVCVCGCVCVKQNLCVFSRVAAYSLRSLPAEGQQCSAISQSFLTQIALIVINVTLLGSMKDCNMAFLSALPWRTYFTHSALLPFIQSS